MASFPGNLFLQYIGNKCFCVFQGEGHLLTTVMLFDAEPRPAQMHWDEAMAERLAFMGFRGLTYRYHGSRLGLLRGGRT
jgi:hypothetical protein